MLDDLWNQRTRPAANQDKLTGEIDALPLGARWVEFLQFDDDRGGVFRLDHHTSNMLLDNDRSAGTVPADKTHVHVLMARLAPTFLAALLERLGLNLRRIL